MARARKGETEGAQGFEQALERLEEIVEQMEKGDLPLEQAMALFEEGVKLGQSCQKRLDEAERRITLLVEQADGALAEEDFDESAPPPAEPPPPRATSPRAPRSSPPAAPRSAHQSPRPSSWSDSDDDDGQIPF